jgi:Cof subfamily protein (haloacid dehalogenase superfamily)
MYYIFADIDGTIRQFDGSVPASTRQAIAELRTNGNKVLICSGRPEVEIEKRILALGFDGIVSAGGARVTLDGKCIMDRTMDDAMARDFVSYAVRHEYVVVSQNHERDMVFQNQSRAYEMIRMETQKHLGKNAAPLLIKPETISDLQEIREIEKFMFFGSMVPTEAITSRFEGRIAFLPFSFPAPVPYGGEACSRGVNKGTAIQAVVEKLGIDPARTIGIGDSDNDLEMLETAGIGIAMGNGNEHAREKADIITDNIGDDGFRNAFVRLHLI